MLTETTRTLVKATAPVLQAHGVALTTHFYARMFQHNPELREVFNQGHQRNGAQQQALAMAVAAYAEHIDNPGVLMPVLERVAAKHVSLGIRSEHYAIVGRHLLASIAEVLGEAATPELIDAWAAAYGQLADIMIGMERALYDESATREGGWTGWRTFRVRRKQPESEEITSFELEPADGGKVPHYRAGQYVSIRVVVPELGYRQPRQYSLSCAPGQDHLRISVKRERDPAQQAEGMVSNFLHGHVAEGDLIEVAPPVGDFYLHEDRDSPVVLVSAGVGITPMVAMLERLVQTGSRRPVRFLHAARHAGVQAFGARVGELIEQLPDGQAWIVHELAQDGQGAGAAQRHAVGRLDLAALTGTPLLPPDADHYVCGPVGFMAEQIRALRGRGVPAERIHAEAFGTGGVPA
ncbi:NO-inducible flavohemoprotein [uncultured Aquabacterium sp.]|jgi:nitric oxide dioxygenase|uniref:NO-inducible flavohemoprotein n=1 Tax=uncultured Aquabacterium sp. TaxID=158753 RepID=UPI00262F73A5|nr:NO-inducible flavohemoprotein [uncultured Aquabacterium sp.]